jgi:hypothetical protein
MAEERRNLFDRGPGQSAELRGAVPQFVAPHRAESRGLGVVPQMGVERGIRHGEGTSVVSGKRAASGLGGAEDRLPGRGGELAASDRATLGADLVQHDVSAPRRQDAQADHLAPPQAGEDRRHHHGPIEEPLRGVGDDREQSGDLVDRQATWLRCPHEGTADLERRVRLDGPHPPGEVIEGRHCRESHADRRRRRRQSALPRAVGEAVHVEGRGDRRICDEGEEAMKRPGIRLERPAAASPAHLLDEEPSGHGAPGRLQVPAWSREPRACRVWLHTLSIAHVVDICITRVAISS